MLLQCTNLMKKTGIKYRIISKIVDFWPNLMMKFALAITTLKMREMQFILKFSAGLE